MNRRMRITHIGNSVTVREHIPDFGLYSPRYIVQFNIVEERDTPIFNGLRRWLDLDSAEYHTIMVHDSSFVGSMRSRETRRDEDAGLSRETLDKLDKKGYKIISMEEVEEEYELDELPTRLEMEIKRRKRERERNQRELERIEKEKDRYSDVEDIKVNDCPNCGGYVAVELDAERSGKIWRGKPVYCERHERDCSEHALNRNF